MSQDSIISQSTAQISAEYILLLAGIIIIVLISMNIYQQYIGEFKNEINESQVKNLLDEIDALNGLI